MTKEQMALHADLYRALETLAAMDPKAAVQSVPWFSRQKVDTKLTKAVQHIIHFGELWHARAH